jgi:hypothetical protein
VTTLPEVEVRRGGVRYTPPTYGPVPLAQARSEGQRVGRYGQPDWTTQRRFATTRAYVLSPWQVEFESWWKGKIRDGRQPSHLFQEEIGIGLPGRFQLDFYGNITHEDPQGTMWKGTQVEVRWALADWNRIPLNPTVYGEWKFNVHGAPDAWEVKVLLTQDFGRRWHAGVNLFFEREVSGDLAEEMGASAALAYGLVDQRFSVGVEAKYERATTRMTRSDPEQEFLLGPSFQWRPLRNTHVDVVPLFGLTDDSPDLEIYVVLGIDLGAGSGSGLFAPTSVRSR